MPIYSWDPSRMSSSTTSCSKHPAAKTDLSHMVCVPGSRSSDQVLAGLSQISDSCSGLGGRIQGLGISQEDLSQIQCSSGFCDNLRSLWKSTMEDEVTQFLGCDDWIPTQRFEVVQQNKVRGCDSATSNLINKTAVVAEKLHCSYLLRILTLQFFVNSGLGPVIVVFKAGFLTRGRPIGSCRSCLNIASSV